MKNKTNPNTVLRLLKKQTRLINVNYNTIFNTFLQIQIIIGLKNPGKQNLTDFLENSKITNGINKKSNKTKKFIDTDISDLAILEKEEVEVLIF